MRFHVFVFSLTLCFFCRDSIAQPQRVPDPQEPQLAPASNDGERVLATFTIPKGLKGELFAAEPMVANPVAIDVDRLGRIFVCETYRQKVAIEDNRDHGHWLDDDLAAQTVEDRRTYIKKHLQEKAAGYMLHDDRIRLLVDTNGDGRADKTTVFAHGFNDMVDGTGAGVLFHEGSVYYTCIPHLWMLGDKDGDGESDERRSLHSGYGVRFAFRGHDMHGLTVGPDGKLYYSIGDRGYNVKSGERHFANPESGAVFRCNLDGSELEVVYTGLRNPQELAFDNYGNLFTVDNNSDSGDKARLVYLVEGGESGWRMAFQYLSDRGPFNREKLWHPFHKDQPAYIIPPIANIADGPSGLTYYPGTGFSDDYQKRFFLCDFRGAAGQSGIRSFRTKPKGAFFSIADETQPFWNILATDLDFGPDGSLFVSDWVHGWDGLGKGRIYRFFDPKKQNDVLVKQVRSLLSTGVIDLPDEKLAGLLEHPDRRVRLNAQFALADRNAADTLARVAQESEHQLARIHAVWGLGQIGRDRKLIEKPQRVILDLLDDKDAELRAQAAKIAGDLELEAAAEKLINCLQNASLRARYFAALSLSKIDLDRNEDLRLVRGLATDGVLTMLAQNKNVDPIVRHGGMMALAAHADPRVLAAYSELDSYPVRLACVLALRRLASHEIDVFLEDDDPRIVVEAARAIHDVPIPEAMPKLAQLISQSHDDESLLRRVLNANYRIGDEANAEALAAFAAGDSAPNSMRLEALEMLDQWGTPSSRDRVLGMWRPDR